MAVGGRLTGLLVAELGDGPACAVAPARRPSQRSLYPILTLSEYRHSRLQTVGQLSVVIASSDQCRSPLASFIRSAPAPSPYLPFNPHQSALSHSPLDRIHSHSPSFPRPRHRNPLSIMAGPTLAPNPNDRGLSLPDNLQATVNKSLAVSTRQARQAACSQSGVVASPTDPRARGWAVEAALAQSHH